jgi:hypothetical protein
MRVKSIKESVGGSYYVYTLYTHYQPRLMCFTKRQASAGHHLKNVQCHHPAMRTCCSRREIVKSWTLEHQHEHAPRCRLYASTRATRTPEGVCRQEGW